MFHDGGSAGTGEPVSGASRRYNMSVARRPGKRPGTQRKVASSGRLEKVGMWMCWSSEGLEEHEGPSDHQVMQVWKGASRRPQVHHR